MRFLSFPILDRQVPDSTIRFLEVLEQLAAELSGRRNVVLHCRQGNGRAGLVAAGLLITRGTDIEEAVKVISTARGILVPETVEQRTWLDRYTKPLLSVP